MVTLSTLKMSKSYTLHEISIWRRFSSFWTNDLSKTPMFKQEKSAKSTNSSLTVFKKVEFFIFIISKIPMFKQEKSAKSVNFGFSCKDILFDKKVILYMKYPFDEDFLVFEQMTLVKSICSNKKNPQNPQIRHSLFLKRANFLFFWLVKSICSNEKNPQNLQILVFHVKDILFDKKVILYMKNPFDEDFLVFEQITLVKALCSNKKNPQNPQIRHSNF